MELANHCRIQRMRRFFTLVTTYPKTVILIMGLLMLALISQLPKLYRDHRTDAFIPPHHPALIYKNKVDEMFGLKEPVVIVVVNEGPHGIFTPKTLELVQWLTEAVLHIPDVETVNSIANEDNVKWSEEEQEFWVDPFLKKIPRTRKELDRLREDLFSFELYPGIIVARDGSAASIIIEPKRDDLADEIYFEVQKLIKEAPASEEKIYVAGEAAVRAYMGVAVDHDAFRLNPLCVVVMAIILFVSYRNLRGIFLPLVVVGGASLMAVGVMAAAHVPIYLITNAILVVIMSIGVADAIHIIGQYYEELLHPRGRTKQHLVVDAAMALWRPVLVTSLTDAAGFMALFLVGIMNPMRYFGLFTAVGIMGALVYSFTVLPAALMLLPLRMSKAFAEKAAADRHQDGLDVFSRTLRRLGRWIYHHWVIVLCTGVITLAIGLLGSTRLILNDARILAFRKSAPIVQADRVLNERFDGTNFFDIVVSTPHKEGLEEPAILRKIDAMEAYAESLDYVGGALSVAGFAKRVNMLMYEDSTEYWAIPDERDEVEFYYDLVRDSDKADAFFELIDRDRQQGILRIMLKSSEFIHTRGVVDAMDKYVKEKFNDEKVEAHLDGRVNLEYHWLVLLKKSHIRSVALAFVAVFLLTAIMFRSVVAGLLNLIPVGFAVLINYAVMGFSNVYLAVGTSMFAAIAIGTGVNFPIHMLDRLKVTVPKHLEDPIQAFESALAFTGRALLFNAAVVTCGFLVLLSSELPILNRFGILIGVGITTAFLSGVTILPALVRAIKPHFIYSSDRKPQSTTVNEIRKHDDID